MSDFANIIKKNIETQAFTANTVPVTEAKFQTHALDITQHVVIEACAGSGKTWLLTARLLRLLLAGTAPQAILAITFTRKATQEMKQRLADMLALLCDANHAERASTLSALGLDDTPALRSQLAQCWQQAFTGGDWPVIATFHEWFASVRKAAPFSLQSAPAAVLTEDEFAHTQRAWQAFWKTSQQDMQLAGHMKTAIAELGLNGFENALKAMFTRRAEWQVYCNSFGDDFTVAQAQAAFEAFLQVKPLEQIALECLPAAKAMRAFPKLYITSSGSKAQDRAEKIVKALILLDDFEAKTQVSPSTNLHLSRLRAMVEALADALSNAKFALPGLVNIVYKPMKPALASYSGGEEGFVADYIKAHTTLNACRDALNTLHLLPAHHGVLYCANALIVAYQQDKLAHGVVDFTDLELEALSVLQATQGANSVADLPWARTQHVLLDEFQDTNPIQWQALQAFLAPLLAESKSGGQAASVFMVGDPKQSIYRFRRADPALFGHVAAWLQAQFGAVVLRTQRTRRNAQAVNTLVNGVFVTPELADPIFAEQFTLSRLAGEVRALPLVAKMGKDDEGEGEDEVRSDLLTQALDGQFGAASPFAGEAQQIAEQLQAWKTTHPTQPWAQVMVLARRRAPLQAVAAALHASGVPCVSDEKGGFFQHPEVVDVLALLTALHAPLDALPTLHALRSPIFGINNAQLGQLLAHWQTAKIQGEDAAPWCGVGSLDADWARNAAALLKQWQWLARHLPTHDALDAMFHQGQLQARFSAAAPPERAPWIAANMQQLLRTALDVDGGRYPSLAKFISHVQVLTASNTLAAEPMTAPDAVRLSTIHSAKGLEAELVVLMDTCSRSKNDDGVHALLGWPATQACPSYFGVALGQPWAGDTAQQAAASSIAASALEQHTLLYVALTRAKSTLWVSGTASKNKVTVYGKVLDALTRHSGDGDQPALDCEAVPEKRVVSPLGLKRQVAHKLAAPQSLLESIPQSAPTLKPYVEPRDTQRGKALHSALQAFMQHGSLPTAAALLGRATLPLSEVLGVLEDAERMVQSLQLPALRADSKVHRLAIEQAWLNQQGEVMRPDLVMYGDSFCWLVDFKTHFKPSYDAARDYALQLQTYLAFLPANAQGFLLTTEGECWHYAANSGLAEQWVLGAVPWVD